MTGTAPYRPALLKRTGLTQGLSVFLCYTNLMAQNIFLQYFTWHFLEIPSNILRAWKKFLRFNLKMKRQGFTLIELLVVIAVIGLISSIVLVQIKTPRGKAQIAKSLQFSKTIQNVLGSEGVGI